MLVSGNMLVDHKIWCMRCGTQGVWVMLLEGCYNIMQENL